MHEVADWIIRNWPFDRLYYYGPALPLHVSHSPTLAGAAFTMMSSNAGHLFPRPLVPKNGSGKLTP